MIASGKGYLADKIIEKAKEADIPFHKDEELAASLSRAGNRSYDSTGAL